MSFKQKKEQKLMSQQKLLQVKCKIGHLKLQVWCDTVKEKKKTSMNHVTVQNNEFLSIHKICMSYDPSMSRNVVIVLIFLMKTD